MRGMSKMTPNALRMAALGRDLTYDEIVQLLDLVDQLRRALVEVEWLGQSVSEMISPECPVCGALPVNPHGKACPVDAALTAAALPDQESRHSVRLAIAARRHPELTFRVTPDGISKIREVYRPMPDARGYVTLEDGTRRQETDAEFRAYQAERLARG